MAVAFLRSARGSVTNNTALAAIPVTINAGETGVLIYHSVGTVVAAVASIAGGGTWTRLATILNANSRIEIWGTGVGAATAATSVTVTGDGNVVNSDGQTAYVAAYSGVTAFGITGTATGTTANPSITIAPSAGSTVVAGFGGAMTVHNTTPVAGTGTLRDSVYLTDASTYNQASALADNTSGTVSVGNEASTWAAAALELKGATGTGPSGMLTGVAAAGATAVVFAAGALSGVAAASAIAAVLAAAALAGVATTTATPTLLTSGTATGVASVGASATLAGAGTATGVASAAGGGLLLASGGVTGVATLTGTTTVSHAAGLRGTLSTLPRLTGALATGPRLTGTLTTGARLVGTVTIVPAP